MADDLNALVELARKIESSGAEKEQQRRSFAYGNTRLENPRITWEIINEQADEITKAKTGE